MKVNVSHNGKLFAANVSMATSFWLKLSGYMFRSTPHVPGILFKTNSIQTTFMKFDLDLVFMTKDMKVIKIIKNLKPWRFTAFYWKARWTLELPIGLLPPDLKEGDTLEVTNV